ncbi:GGDEF domain-containing protein [Vibrio anguillarum]|uniref:diguanylate cyclase n=1 Tax=Vibrio anguillarum TaxID=55601 RepID=A0A1Q1KET8_VIBAN|nr:MULTISPECIES: diguanylate cyclase [Vibrio]NCO45129.1 diguanylate cyclase [Vibrio sp.]AGU58175.1 diguanylate cyclase [Vibrio anguillarum M3]AQM20061.1 diguanylate cyclase [Vibrio anguillarum]AQP36616.1 diguanylate cyclase [Vibrio anguillarum]ARV27102.1 diguanylate cyclase domain protein [Vibrio anguillarum]
MGALEQDIQTQLQQLKTQLEQVRLTHRDTSFKFKREHTVLKRIVASLSLACQGNDHQLNINLSDLREALEQQKDVSTLIPRLAVLERMLKQQTLVMEKENSHLDSQIKHCGETLLRVAGLPAKLKRDLRDLLSFSEAQPKAEQAIQLLGIYERAIKIITANPNTAISELHVADRELLTKLSDELQHLITELDFEGESGELLVDIRAKLLIGVSTSTLLELTLEILKLVIDGTNSERKTSEKFLEQVNSSLTKHIKSSTHNADQSQSYFEHRQEMNAELAALITQSQTLIKDSVAIDDLKLSVSPILCEMASLSERLSHAEQREQALIERLNYGKNQMEALFELTQDYRRRLEDQSQRLLLDPLTKVYNRTAFNDHLELEYRRWIRAQHTFRIVIFDIDKFKTINDSFGYTAGDKALKIIARTISKEASDTDTVARFSGEEFIILLPDQEDNHCFKVVKNIQRHVSRLPFKFRDKSITITLSAASTCFKDSDTPEEVLERLRRSLLEAKSFGPNQVVWK